MQNNLISFYLFGKSRHVTFYRHFAEQTSIGVKNGNSLFVYVTHTHKYTRFSDCIVAVAVEPLNYYVGVRDVRVARSDAYDYYLPLSNADGG